MRLTYVVISMCLTGTLSAQDISGKWTGWLSQETGGVFPNYYFEMDLLAENGEVTGTSYDHVKSGVVEHHCSFTVEGTYSEDEQVFSFVETGEIESVTTGMTPPRGCIIQGDLQYSSSNDMEYLIGEWSGVLVDDESYPCPPGRIYLERAIMDTTPEVVTFPELFEEREVVYDKDYKVWNEEIDIVVWDNNVIDHDIISLSFNGEWVLRNHTLSSERETITVTIDPLSDNVLILHAENEGEIPPNTAAIRVYDGKRTKMFTLSSNMDSSGALVITHDPKD